jgi:hypothetical protein
VLKLIVFMIPFAMLFGSDKAPAGKETKKPAPAAAPKSGSISIPSDAVEIGPQVYRYKDPEGRSWIYRKTPFGISRMEEMNAGQPPAALMAAPVPAGDSKIKVTAVDKGESVRFEQQTPMGPRVWERKKSELTPQESAWLEHSNNSNNPDSKKPEK